LFVEELTRTVLESGTTKPGAWEIPVTFVEGFDTSDLKDAKALLDELAT
jgi:hypothetical protein